MSCYLSHDAMLLLGRAQGAPQHVPQRVHVVGGQHQVREEERDDVRALGRGHRAAVEELLQRLPRGESSLELHEAEPDLQVAAGFLPADGDQRAQREVVVGQDRAVRLPRAQAPLRGAAAEDADAVGPAQLQVHVLGLPVVGGVRLDGALRVPLAVPPAEVALLEVREQRLQRCARGAELVRDDDVLEVVCYNILGYAMPCYDIV